MDFATLRRHMVDNQIRTVDVTDRRLLAALLAVPRESFVPAAQKPFAYSDREIPLAAGAGEDRCLMAPAHLARLVQALALRPSDVALVVGCGTGYSAAVMARLAASVVAVEEDEGLARFAEERLRRLGVDNAAVVQGPLTEGYPGEGPYDAILVDGAVEVLPPALAAQLNRGGRLAVIERRGRLGRALLCERTDGDVARRPLFDCWASLLPGFRRRPAFVF